MSSENVYGNIDRGSLDIATARGQSALAPRVGALTRQALQSRIC